MKSYDRRKNLPENLNWDKNGNWKGGVIKRKDGYILIRIASIPQKATGARYKLQHRVVMERKLGRPLLRSEVVHHINHNKSDNRIKNLKVISQSKHATEHYKERKKDKKGRLI